LEGAHPRTHVERETVRITTLVRSVLHACIHAPLASHLLCQKVKSLASRVAGLCGGACVSSSVRFQRGIPSSGHCRILLAAARTRAALSPERACSRTHRPEFDHPARTRAMMTAAAARRAIPPTRVVSQPLHREQQQAAERGWRTMRAGGGARAGAERASPQVHEALRGDQDRAQGAACTNG
jgi:hypothetical protein